MEIASQFKRICGDRNCAAGGTAVRWVKIILARTEVGTTTMADLRPTGSRSD